MPTTAFKLPTAVRPMPVDGGSGSVNNEQDILTGGYAVFELPDGSSYTPTSDEIAAGHVLPPTVLQHSYDFSAVPSNAIITGITVKTTIYSENVGNIDPSNGYFLQLSTFPNEVNFYDEFYLWLEPKEAGAPLNDSSLQTIGGTTDVWQPNPNLTKDGMFMFATDGGFHGCEVQTSTLDPFAYDFFYNGHDMLIQPYTSSYSGSSLDASDAFASFNFVSFVTNGGTVTVSFPGFFPPTTFVAQFGPATPGDATFQCTVDNDISLTNLSNQIGYHPDTSTYMSSSIFSGAQVWELASIDVGSYTNGINISSNIPSAFNFPNGGQFSGGSDPDPNISVMANYEAIAPFNNAGGPMYARVVGDGVSQNLQITNTITNMTLKHSVPASLFKNPLFGISAFYDWNTYGGDVLNYPSVAGNNQKLGITSISLTYDLAKSGGLLLLGVG